MGGSVSIEGPVSPMAPELATHWKSAFDSFHESRKPNGDAIADLALANFHEVNSNERHLNK
jgi:hypothetical protein